MSAAGCKHQAISGPWLPLAHVQSCLAIPWPELQVALFVEHTVTLRKGSRGQVQVRRADLEHLWPEALGVRIVDD